MAKKALGRGLDSLMPTLNEKTTTGQGEHTQTLPLSSLYPNPDQPRKHFPDKQLKELAQSIERQGIIQPILAEKKEEGYLIVSGERRYRAAKIAGLDAVPVIVKTLNENERLEVGLIENVQREDLNAIEEAQGYRTLIETFNYTQEDLAGKIGKSRSAIANSLRLLRLPESIQEGLLRQVITAGHARALLTIKLEYKMQMTELYTIIVEEGLSVRAVEDAVRIINTGKEFRPFQKASGSQLPPNKRDKHASHSPNQQRIPELIEMEELLIKALGTRVEIKGSASEGKIVIQYYNSDDLSRLYDLLLTD